MSHFIVYASEVLTHPDAVLDGQPLYLPVWCGGDNNVYEDVQSGRRARDWSGYWVGSFNQVLIEMIQRHAASACGGGLRRAKERVTHPESLIRSWRKKLQNPLAVRGYQHHGISPSLKFSVPKGTPLPALAEKLLQSYPSHDEKWHWNDSERNVWCISLEEPEGWIVAAQLRSFRQVFSLTVDVRGPRV